MQQSVNLSEKKSSCWDREVEVDFLLIATKGAGRSLLLKLNVKAKVARMYLQNVCLNMAIILILWTLFRTQCCISHQCICRVA